MPPSARVGHCDDGKLLVAIQGIAEGLGGGEERRGEGGGGRGDGVDDAGENREATKQGSN